MPIRDIVLTLLVFGALPVAFARPYIGVLLFTWLSLMNPHRLTWGFAFDMPFALMASVVTLAGLLFTRDRRPLPMVRETVLLLALWALAVVSTVFAQYPDDALEYLSKVSKILLMVFVTVMLFQERRRLRWLLLVMAVSVGFYGVKGGIWGLTGGGGERVYGPPRSFIADNNALALALNMTLPLLWFLAEEEPRRWARHALRAAFGLSIVAVLLTYSRGGLLGLIVVLAGLWLRVSLRMKIVLLVAGLLGWSLLSGFLPEKWYARMDTIQTYEQDTSAMGRLKAWEVGWRMAVDRPLLGAGFQAFTPETFARYLPDYPGWHNAHSVYFLVLGELGFTGLALYMAVMICTFLSLNGLRRKAARGESEAWVGNYARMLQVSLAGFAVAGIFQNLSYFDFYFLLVGITIMLKRVSQEAIAVPQSGHTAATPTPTGRRPPARLTWIPGRN